MKLHSSLHKSFNKKKALVAENGEIKFNNKKTILNQNTKTKSSQKWLRRQINDPFANAAKIEGYLARSAYKLIEIQHKYSIFDKNTKIVIDLGCSPGSWSQVILTNKFCKNVNVIGLDLLPMKFKHKNLFYIQGDFEDVNVKKKLISMLKNLSGVNSVKNAKVDCIVCDIAMNSVGDSSTDRLRSERILENVLSFCKKHLNNNGNLVCKAIKGADAAIFNEIKNNFKLVYRFKPKSSRKNSSELFLIGKFKKE